MNDAELLERAIERYRALIAEDPALEAELGATAGEFLGVRVDAPAGDAAMAERRHLEWFLLERPSTSLRRIPIEALEERWLADCGPKGREVARALRDSHASVFEVTGVARRQGMWLRDLAGYGEYPIDETEASLLIEEGDLIVGRLFPLGESAYHVSRAAGFFRNPILRDALSRDLAAARAERRGVLRVAQNELETMFWGRNAPELRDASSDPVGEARRLLIDGGLEPAVADGLLAELAAAPPAPALVGSGDALSAVLDRLAFDTTIDLERARVLLVAAWQVLHAERKATAEPRGTARAVPGETGGDTGVDTGGNTAVDDPGQASGATGSDRSDVARAVEAFERGRAGGGDLDALFDALERDLALADESGDEDDASAVPDFPGVVGAMIEEFRWEVEREHGGEASKSLAPLELFARYAEQIGVFENLRAYDLMTFTCYWLPESGAVDNADDARALLAALQRFCRWAEEKQEVSLHSTFEPAFRGLKTTLPRIAEANRRRTRSADKKSGDLFEVAAVGEHGALELVDRRSGQATSSEVDPWLAPWLRAGDHLRASRLADGRLAVYCCYPPQFAELAAGIEAGD